MALWIIALVVFAAARSLKAVGTSVHMRHDGPVMGEASRTWPDGFLSAGHARSHFGAGATILLGVSPDRIVRRLMIMKGRSVFARFAPWRGLEGTRITTCRRTPRSRTRARGATFGSPCSGSTKRRLGA